MFFQLHEMLGACLHALTHFLEGMRLFLDGKHAIDCVAVHLEYYCPEVEALLIQAKQALPGNIILPAIMLANLCFKLALRDPSEH